MRKALVLSPVLLLVVAFFSAFVLRSSNASPLLHPHNCGWVGCGDGWFHPYQISFGYDLVVDDDCEDTWWSRPVTDSVGGFRVYSVPGQRDYDTAWAAIRWRCQPGNSMCSTIGYAGIEFRGGWLLPDGSYPPTGDMFVVGKCSVSSPGSFWYDCIFPLDTQYDVYAAWFYPIGWGLLAPYDISDWHYKSYVPPPADTPTPSLTPTSSPSPYPTCQIWAYEGQSIPCNSVTVTPWATVPYSGCISSTAIAPYQEGVSQGYTICGTGDYTGTSSVWAVASVWSALASYTHLGQNIEAQHNIYWATPFMSSTFTYEGSLWSAGAALQADGGWSQFEACFDRCTYQLTPTPTYTPTATITPTITPTPSNTPYPITVTPPPGGTPYPTPGNPGEIEWPICLTCTIPLPVFPTPPAVSLPCEGPGSLPGICIVEQSPLGLTIPPIPSLFSGFSVGIRPYKIVEFTFFGYNLLPWLAIGQFAFVIGVIYVGIRSLSGGGSS